VNSQELRANTMQLNTSVSCLKGAKCSYFDVAHNIKIKSACRFVTTCVQSSSLSDA